jgi:hypothetical protein
MRKYNRNSNNLNSSDDYLLNTLNLTTVDIDYNKLNSFIDLVKSGNFETEKKSREGWTDFKSGYFQQSQNF